MRSAMGHQRNSHSSTHRAPVAGARPDRLAPGGRERLEEQVEHLLSVTLMHPDDASPVVVDDHGHVRVALPVAGLVHADGTQPVEQARTLLRSQVVGDPSAYRAHALPVHAHQPAHRSSGRVHARPRRLLFEIARVRALASGPRHHRDGHPVPRAIAPPGRVLQHEPQPMSR